MRYELDVNRDISLAHPHFGCQLWKLVQACEAAYSSGQAKYRWRVFELYRHPDRQDYLLHQGTTKAGAWHSAHQFGLAADFAVWTPAETWSWPDQTTYSELHALGRSHGMTFPIQWDPGHCESPHWPSLKNSFFSLK